MRTFRDAKTMAKTLRAELLERKQIELGHSGALEIVSRMFGHDNWNIMAAKIDDLHEELNKKRLAIEVWSPAVWVPQPEEMPWGRVMTVTDPFGNSFRFTEPHDTEKQRLARW